MTNGCHSPEPEPSRYPLSPRSEAKHGQKNEEFVLMMRRSAQVTGYKRQASFGTISGYVSSKRLMQPSPQMSHTVASPRLSSSDWAVLDMTGVTSNG